MPYFPNAISNLPKPSEIEVHLDRYVRGQQPAKRALANSVYYHLLGWQYLKTLQEKPKTSGLPFGSQHLFLIGASGCGKSFLVKLVAQFLDVPYTFISAANLVPSGCAYGTSINDLIESHYLACDKNLDRAQQGIIFIDEIDKIRLRGDLKHDSFIQGIQDSLLAPLDGCPISVSTTGQRYLPMAPRINIDTTGILFICAGACAGLSEIIATRLSVGKKNSLGFNCMNTEQTTQERSLDDTEILKLVETKDLVDYGFLTEFVDRFTAITVIDSLKADDLVEILISAHDSIFHKKKHLFALYGVELVFTESALSAIAQKALTLKTGARALTRVFQDCLRDLEYQLPELAETGVYQITINETTIERGQPVLLYDAQKENNK